MLPDIKSLTREDLEAQFKAWGEPAYRVTQLLDWLYVRRADSWEAMSNLPKTLREKLRGQFTLQTIRLARKQGADDTTQKFLWRLADGSFIESVLIPANPALYGEASDRHTLCISTQVGCAYGCKFCASGLEGWKRNLAVHEIIEQVLAVERYVAGQGASEVSEPNVLASPRSSTPLGEGEGEKAVGAGSAPRRKDARAVDNIVVMGMGEPLANYDNLLKALKILNAPWGGRIGARKITISTSGLAPQIRQLAREPFQFRLAISLHGATDEVRQRIMPVNKKYPLAELVAACDDYQKLKGRMITLEYILIGGVNDSLDQIRPLAAIARKLFAKVNLIPYNRVEDLPWERPSEEVCERFLAALEKQKVIATLRREKGGDIDAACGQLRLKTERELTRGLDSCVAGRNGPTS
ncbi:MAG TPA: 23S rRNA (adenine(2503)-C(2))-methyltransferase RlmN [Verrucomicrobiae bacterium]